MREIPKNICKMAKPGTKDDNAFIILKYYMNTSVLTTFVNLIFNLICFYKNNNSLSTRPIHNEYLHLTKTNT